MLISVDQTGSMPLYEQLLAQLRGAILRGEVGPGDRLPPARDLAATLGINMHTVLRAYGALRDEGLLHLRRGRGAVVSDTPLDTAEWEHALTHLLDVAARNGLGPADVRAAIDERFARREP